MTETIGVVVAVYFRSFYAKECMEPNQTAPGMALSDLALNAWFAYKLKLI